MNLVIRYHLKNKINKMPESEKQPTRVPTPKKSQIATK